MNTRNGRTAEQATLVEPLCSKNVWKRGCSLFYLTVALGFCSNISKGQTKGVDFNYIACPLLNT